MDKRYTVKPTRMPTSKGININIHLGIDGNRRLNFFRYGHHGQTSFVGGG